MDAGVRTLSAYDEFLSILDDDAKRRELTSLGVDDAPDSDLFMHVTELGREFQAGLLSLLFDDDELSRWVREYVVF